MITHRLVGLEIMDEILVLREGQLVERGTHASLIQQAGLYRRMLDLQNNILDNEPVESV
jgi:ATP-binding cassette subfamily C protein CydC